MGSNKIKFTLDNIIYNCTSKDDSLIEIILPRRTPTTTEHKSLYSKEKSVTLSPTVQIEIKMFLTVLGKIPKLLIQGESKKSKIIFANSIDIKANSTNQLRFTTIDGGSTWLVELTTFYSKQPPSETSIISINGQTGPTVVLDSTNIYLNGDKGPTISEQFTNINNTIISMKETVKSDVTKDIVTILPDMIRIEMKDSEIIAEKI